MAKRKKRPPKLDLSKYANVEKLPANVIAIIKNALVVYDGNTNSVAKFYNLPQEKVDMIYEEFYLQLTQIISTQTKSKELDKGIDNAILLMTEHINTLQNSKSSNLMSRFTVNDITKMTDRMISLKSQFNNTYDILINKLQEQSLKQRQIEVLENGKPEDYRDYDENVETVFTKLQSRLTRPIKATNIQTKEVKHYNSINDATFEFKCNGDTIRKRLADKCLFRDVWAFEEE